MAKSKLTPEEMKQIAAWASTHRDWSDAEIADLFSVTESQIRYARKKWSELSDLAVNTKKGREMLGQLISSKIDDTEELEKQVTTIIGQLSVDTNMAPATRLRLMKDVMVIKDKLLKTSVAGVLRSSDARLLVAVIKRFVPNASKKEILQIIAEEKMKLKA